jgi:DNA-binding transcriptional regulator YdaS (Cro superfamily)
VDKPIELVALERACELLGGQVKLSEAISGASPQAISQWRKRGRVPAERVLEIETATGGKVSRHDLRPDIYPRERRKAAV